MLARRLATILPAMSLAEAPETTRIHSVAGRTTLVKMRSYYPGVCHPTAIRMGDGNYTEAI